MSFTSQPTLVTGASGFVGAAVARALLAAGRPVRVLMRPSSDRRNIDGLDVETAIGALEDPASLAAALRGCGALFHVAADYRLWVRDPAPMYAANVDGTRRLMQEAAAAGVERIVYTSSVAVLGLPKGGVADEASPSRLEDMIGPYKRSKFLAEEAVRALVRDEGLPAVIVNPSTPVGPRDVKPTPTGRMIVEAASGRMPAFVDTGLNIVHVEDVAAGHLLAEAKGKIGERYILGGDNLSLAAILGIIAGIVGRKPPKISVPIPAIWPIALAAEGIGRLTGREPFVTLDGLRMAKKHMFFSSAKAERDLGFRARPAADGLGDAVRWFRDAGYCPVTIVLAGVAALSLAIWLVLVLARGWFWWPLTLASAPAPVRWPSVGAVVPARDEAEVIARAISSLLQQDYPGPFSVVLVDDHSSDGTADLARRAATASGHPERFRLVSAMPLPEGWTGKLWALAQGIASVEAGTRPELLLCTDADIEHHPSNLRELVAQLEAGRCDLVSLMVLLRCRDWAERFLIPAFVFFFALLYPFRRVNDRRSKVAAAAGGCVLWRMSAHDRIGGYAAIRGDLIDDCALATAVKRSGGGVHLALTRGTRSLRAYPRVGDIWDMVARTAYTQLGYSPLVLALTVLGLALTYLAPPLLVLAGGAAAWLAGAAWLLMAAAYMPMLRFYGLSAWWGPLLPAIALVYLAATLDSARRHWRGIGGAWKGRMQWQSRR